MNAFKRPVRFVVLGVVLAFIVGAAPAYAVPVTVPIRAEVESITDASGIVGDAVKVGDVIEGTYVYDPTAPDTFVDPLNTQIGEYRYNAPPYGMWLAVNGLQFRTDALDPQLYVEVDDDEVQPGGAWDRYNVGCEYYGLFDLVVPPGDPEDHVYNTMIVQWVDYDHSVLTSDALADVEVPLDLSEWESAYVFLRSYRHGPIDVEEEFIIWAKVLPAETVSTPASSPWSLVLLAGLAVGAAVVIRRRYA